MAVIEEIKVHKNKATQHFLCNVLHRDTDYLVVSFHSQQEGKIKDIIIPKGSTTVAHYWSDRGYVLWRINGPNGLLIGNLFHICTDMEITEKYVRYLDLIVDIWVAPDGTLRVLDEDELEECRKAGVVSQAESFWIEKQKKLILRSHAAIIDNSNTFILTASA